jgi:hypothetical protein
LAALLGHAFELLRAVLHDSPCGGMTHLFHHHARFAGLPRQCLALRSLSSLATVGAVSAPSAQWSCWRCLKSTPCTWPPPE